MARVADRLAGYGLAVFLTAAGIGCGAIGVHIGQSLHGQHPNQFDLEFAKALLTLATGLILGGAVKVLLDHFQERAKAREEELARHERLLADLRGVHDRAERVRLLVAARRSAKAYNEHMEALIGCQVLLLKVKRTFDVSRRHGADRATNDFLMQMLGYLRALQYEYRDRYKAVSDCQRYDEAVTTRRFARAADHEVVSGADGEPAPQSSQRAWDLLSDDCEFPVLADLTKQGPRYQDHFLKPFHALAAEMVPGGQRRSADLDFDAEVDARAVSIRSRCEEVAAEAAAMS